MSALPENDTRFKMSFAPGLESLSTPLTGLLHAVSSLNPAGNFILVFPDARVRLNGMSDDI